MVELCSEAVTLYKYELIHVHVPAVLYCTVPVPYGLIPVPQRRLHPPRPPRLCGDLGMLLVVLASHALLTAPRGSPEVGGSRFARSLVDRRHFMAIGGAVAALGLPTPARALIKGSAPPPSFSGPKERKCKSIEECEALGDAERAKADAGADTTIERTVGGDRYRDLMVGSGGKAVSNGDTVEIRYRVMRLGTKARDGLSGEGQTIFSYGFGEDEDKEGDKLTVQVGC